MNNQKLVQETLASLQSKTNEDRKEFAKGYYPSEFRILGNTVPDIRKIAADLKRKIKSYPIQDQFELMCDLIDTEIHECQQVAFINISSSKKLLAYLDQSKLQRIEKGMDNWVSTDLYSMKILGVLWREDQIETDYLIAKAKSTDLWDRRIALASTVALNLKSAGKEFGEPDKTTLITDILIEDPEEMVVKAMSWALRELGKRNPTLALTYVEENSDRLHRKIVREVTNRLTKGHK